MKQAQKNNEGNSIRNFHLPVDILPYCCASICVAFIVRRSFCELAAGLSVGISGLAAGYAIGIVGDTGVRGCAVQPKLFVGMILILIFAEVLGLYGLIIALILHSKD